MQANVFSIETHDITIIDPARGKELPLRVTFPLSSGRYPVIIFSHGAGGSGKRYEYLAQSWSRHGYICVQPTHDDSIEWNLVRKTRKSFIQTMRELPTDTNAWINRARDVSFVIDTLHTLPSRIPALSGMIDKTRVGAGGHSLGAFTTQLLVGASVPTRRHAVPTPQLKDARIKAIVALSPQGVRTKAAGLSFDSPGSFNGITLPALFETGDRDISNWNDAAQRHDAFKYCAPGDKYFVCIDGANHMTFVGDLEELNKRQKFARSLWEGLAEKFLPPAIGDENMHRELVEKTTQLFWDAYLKDDANARNALIEDGALEQIMRGKGHAALR